MTSMSQRYSMIQICSYHIHFQKQIQALNFSLFFSMKHTTNFIHNCNLQTTTNECNFFHFHFMKHNYKILTNSLTIIIGDFNINMLTSTIETTTLKKNTWIPIIFILHL